MQRKTDAYQEPMKCVVVKNFALGNDKDQGWLSVLISWPNTVLTTEICLEFRI